MAAPKLPRIEHRTTFLYRAFNADGDLLYVGISCDTEQRFKNHARRSAWWPEVERITQEWFPNRRAALAAERKAIETEGAIHNVTPTEAARRTVEGARPIREAKKELRRRFAGEIQWAHENRRNCPVRDCHTCIVRELEDRIAAKEAESA